MCSSDLTVVPGAMVVVEDERGAGMSVEPCCVVRVTGVESCVGLIVLVGVAELGE